MCVTDLFVSVFYILHNIHLTSGLGLGGLGLRCVHSVLFRLQGRGAEMRFRVVRVDKVCSHWSACAVMGKSSSLGAILAAEKQTNRQSDRLPLS